MEDEVAVDSTPEVTTEVAQTTSPEVDAEARAQGWVPKEEFRGKESDWIEAEVFVQRGREINPILRKNNERIQRELDQTKRQMEQLRAATEEFKKFQQEAYDKKLSSYEVELSDLRELKRRAMSENDGALVIEIEDKIDSVKAEKELEAANKPKPLPEIKVDPAVDPVVQEWEDRNPWYNNDLDMQNAANNIASIVKKANPNLFGKDFLDKVDEKLASMFAPERLGKKQKVRNPVEGSSPSAPSSSNDKSYEKLPADAKAACDKFVKQKIMTRAEYVAMYDFN